MPTSVCYGVALMGVSLLMLAACSGGDSDNANIRLLNVSHDYDSLDLYVNTTQDLSGVTSTASRYVSREALASRATVDRGRTYPPEARSPESSVLRIEAEIERIDPLVGDLLKLFRLESGELTEMEEAVDVHELVHDVVTDADFEAQASGRNVVWHEQGSAILRGQGAFCTARLRMSSEIRSNMRRRPALFA